jgi:hypothetical protein
MKLSHETELFLTRLTATMLISRELDINSRKLRLDEKCVFLRRQYLF